MFLCLMIQGVWRAFCHKINLLLVSFLLVKWLTEDFKYVFGEGRRYTLSPQAGEKEKWLTFGKGVDSLSAVTSMLRKYGFFYTISSKCKGKEVMWVNIK